MATTVALTSGPDNSPSLMFLLLAKELSVEPCADAPVLR